MNRFDRAPKPESSDRMRDAARIHDDVGRWEILALLVLTAAAVYLRLTNLTVLPLGAAGTEEGTSWIVTAAQLRHGWPILPSGLSYLKGWPYTLSAALASALFGLSVGSLRLPSALAGIASVPIVWWGARAILHRLALRGWPAAIAALFAAYLLTFSEWCLLMSRWGRFYTMGQTLFLAGVVVAVWGFTALDRPATRAVTVFGLLLFLASATFHSGAMLLLAIPAALLLGVHFDRRQSLILATSVGATVIWFVGVLFFWKTGHVRANGGWQDLLLVTGPAFWKHIVIIAGLGLGGWSLMARPGSTGRPVARVFLALLVLLELVIAAAAGWRGADNGALRGFHTLSQGHAGVMCLALLGSLVLLIGARGRPDQGRQAAGILWLMTVVPIALVGASTGNFVPRYLLFTFGPLAVVSAVAIAFVLSLPASPAMRRVALALVVPIAVAVVWPAVNPVAARRIIDDGIGATWPPLYACSPTRPYALDLESPSRFVAQRLTNDDLVVSTARSIPEAIIGRMDYFFRVPIPGNARFDESGDPFNILTGCPMLTSAPQVLDLCVDRRVFVILDETAMRLAEVLALRAELVRRLGAADFKRDHNAEVYVIPVGCALPPEPAATLE